MSEATVFAKYVNPPRDGNSWWSVKDEQGAYWSCKEAVAQRIVKGQRNDVEYSTRDVNGKTYKTITSVKERPQGAPASNGAGMVNAAWQVPNFVSNVVGQAITAGIIKEPIEIKKWALAAREAGEAVLAPRNDDPPPYEDNDYR